MEALILVGLTFGCFTTFRTLDPFSTSAMMMPSATLIMATRSSSLPQPSSIKATTEFPSAANLDRNTLMNLITSAPLKRYGEVSESKASNIPLWPTLPCNLVVAMLMLFKSAQLAHTVSERGVHVSPTVWVKASTKLSAPGGSSIMPFSLRRPTISAGPCSVVTKMTGLSITRALSTT